MFYFLFAHLFVLFYLILFCFVLFCFVLFCLSCFVCFDCCSFFLLVVVVVFQDNIFFSISIYESFNQANTVVT